MRALQMYFCNFCKLINAWLCCGTSGLRPPPLLPKSCWPSGLGRAGNSTEKGKDQQGAASMEKQRPKGQGTAEEEGSRHVGTGQR